MDADEGGEHGGPVLGAGGVGVVQESAGEGELILGVDVVAGVLLRDGIG